LAAAATATAAHKYNIGGGGHRRSGGGHPSGGGSKGIRWREIVLSNLVHIS